MSTAALDGHRQLISSPLNSYSESNQSVLQTQVALAGVFTAAVDGHHLLISNTGETVRFTLAAGAPVGLPYRFRPCTCEPGALLPFCEINIAWQCQMTTFAASAAMQLTALCGCHLSHLSAGSSQGVVHV